MAGKKVIKADLVNQIYRETDLSPKAVKLVLDRFFEVVKKNLVENKAVELRGFGTFELKQRKGRIHARNPKTGVWVEAKPHCVVTFRSGKELRQLVWNVQKETPSP